MANGIARLKTRGNTVSKQAFYKMEGGKKRAEKRARALATEYKSTGFALGNGALFLAGSAGGGVVRAYMPTIGALPSDVGIGLILAGVGTAGKMPKAIYLSMGFLSAWVGGYAQETTEKYLYGSGSVAVPGAALSNGG
jgi:hypothetical protein